MLGQGGSVVTVNGQKLPKDESLTLFVESMLRAETLNCTRCGCLIENSYTSIVNMHDKHHTRINMLCEPCTERTIEFITTGA